MALHRSLAGATVAFAVVWVVAYVLGRACGTFVPTDDVVRARRRIRWILLVLVPVTYVLALFAMTAGGWLTVADRVASPLPGAGEGLVSLAVGFGVPAFTCTAPYLGLFPRIRAARGLEMTTTDAAAVVGRYVAGFVGFVAVGTIAILSVWAALGTAAGYVIALYAIAGASLVFSPVTTIASASTRRPTADERARLDAAADEAGVTPRWVRVQSMRGAAIATAYVRGVPGLRALFVTDDLLDSVDHDGLAGAIALRTGRAAVFHTEAKVLIVMSTAAVVGVPFLVPSLPIPGVVVSGTGLLIGLLALWLGRRLVYRADTVAAERVGAERAFDAIETIVELNDGPRSVGPVRSLLGMEPSIESRLVRLRERADRPVQ